MLCVVSERKTETSKEKNKNGHVKAEKNTESGATETGKHAHTNTLTQFCSSKGKFYNFPALQTPDSLYFGAIT